MTEILTIKIKNSKVLQVLEGLEELKMIKIINDPLLNLSGKKKKQAKDFLAALNQAKLAEQGKIKLKTAQSLIDEL
jgi:hypothetical protein